VSAAPSMRALFPEEHLYRLSLAASPVGTNNRFPLIAGLKPVLGSHGC
jgi:hypothetical protein